jgi:hypothetical protein
MASFSASDAALTGFRIVREHPRALLVWIGVQLVRAFVMTTAMVQLIGPALSRLNSAGVTSTRDPAQAAAIVQQLGPFYLLIVGFGVIYYPVVYSTMNRVVLRPGEAGFGYIRLGVDELRQIGLLLLVFLLSVAAYFALIVVMVIGGVSVSLVAGGGPGATSGNLAVGLVLVLLALIALSLWIYVWVRLSLASPLTFASRRIDLFGSWRLTRGLFWPMLGSYVVAIILAMIVTLLTLAISLAVSAAMGGGLAGLQGVFRPDTTSVAAYMSPARIVTVAIGAISSALVWPVLVTPAAAIYRSLPEAVGLESAAATFD